MRKRVPAIIDKIPTIPTEEAWFALKDFNNFL